MNAFQDNFNHGTPHQHRSHRVGVHNPAEDEAPARLGMRILRDQHFNASVDPDTIHVSSLITNAVEPDHFSRRSQYLIIRRSLALIDHNRIVVAGTDPQQHVSRPHRFYDACVDVLWSA